MRGLLADDDGLRTGAFGAAVGRLVGAFGFVHEGNLAAVGLYGTLAYAVAQRTREIGIRIALGATRSRIASGVLANGIGLAAVGLVVGLVAAVWATKLIQKMLYGVSPNDAIAYLASGVVLLGVAALACVVPTRRATSVDAMVAMRAD